MEKNVLDFRVAEKLEEVREVKARLDSLLEDIEALGDSPEAVNLKFKAYLLRKAMENLWTR